MLFLTITAIVAITGYIYADTLIDNLRDYTTIQHKPVEVFRKQVALDESEEKSNETI